MTDKPTVYVLEYSGKYNQITREEYVIACFDNAGGVLKISIDICEQAAVAAGEQWDQLYDRQHSDDVIF